MGDLNVRKSCQNKLNALLNQARTHLTTPLDYHALTTIRTRARTTMEKCERTQDKLLAAATTDEAVALQETAFIPIEAVFQEIENFIAKALLAVPVPGTVPGGGAAPSAAAATAGINVKLPTIELPTFDGNFANWVSFKDLFLATVDSSAQLSRAQKLQYLKSSLQGEPANLINAMSITDANYTESWQLLNERYDNKREIVQSLITRFLNHKRLQSESAQELQALIDCVNESIRALKVLHCPVDHWDDLLVVIVLNKLDPATRREWAIRQNGNNLPTFMDFSKFLLSHIRGLLASNPNNSTGGKGSRHIKVHHVSSDLASCEFCSGSHHHHQCSQFHSKTPAERSLMVKQHKLCFNCLGKSHSVKKCSSKSSCKKCGKRHHTLLHNEDRPSAANPAASTASATVSSQHQPQQSHNIQSHHASLECEVAMKTALALVEDRHGGKQPFRVLIDGGSQGELVSVKCSRSLQLKVEHAAVTVTGVGPCKPKPVKGQVELKLYNRFDSSKSITIKAYILNKLTGQLPSTQCQVMEWPHIRGLELADPEWYKPAPVDIIIGIKYFAKIIGTERRMGPDGAPAAYNSIFGWIIAGEVPTAESTTNITSFHVRMDPDLDFIKKFWEIEEPPAAASIIMTEEERLCEEHFMQTCSRDHTGRYHVRIPFNGKQHNLGLSKETALRRLYSVERRLQRQQSHREQYIDFMREYISLGHMSLVPPEKRKEVPGRMFYLPHHFVVNESSTTTKLRVVFDGSAKSSSGISLNDAMMVGATIQDDLFDQLLRFRVYPIVLKADIAKMFRNFGLHPEDQEYHRILWRESPDEEVQEYYLVTITYGTACATFLSTRCLKKLSVDIKEKYPVASEALATSMFVDDLMYGKSTPEEAIEAYKQLNSAMIEAGMDLRKWSTNNPEVLAAIPEDKRDIMPHSFGENPVKTLGVHWYPAADVFQFSEYQFSNDDLTKRNLLSDLSRVFDPLGLIVCVTVRAKLIFQELWRCGINWDDPVPEYVKQPWEEYKEDIKQLVDIPIPRRITVSHPTSVEIHAFADASSRGLGGCIYLRSVTPTGVVVNLVASKTRVAPVKPVTIPRLELCAALETAKLAVHVRKSLKFDYPLYMWSDSTITLHWIASPARRWKTFVAHRVAKIQQLTPVECWRHVAGTENPADLASRGVPVSQIKNDTMWFHGPKWLSEEQLPIFVAPPMDQVCNAEERKLPILVHAADMEKNNIIERFSSLIRLKRVTAYIMRAYQRSKKKDVATGPLQPVELKDAMKQIIRQVQQQHYSEEISCLQKKKEMKHSSKLKRLNPFLDSDGVLRVGGRLHNASVPECTKHQAIIPGDSHLLMLLVYHYHHFLFHAGFQHVWSSIMREYWIVGGRDRVRHIIRSCVTCRRYRAANAEQLMGQLPISRVTPARPFLKTGVDFCGPFMLKNPIGRAPKTYKGYLCVFVCMVTKAVHLEAVSSLSTEAFLDAMRRFVSRRGLCSDIYSDCGTNFVGADHELKKLLHSKETQGQVSNHLSNVSIRWHFNAPSSPHHGGLWEAAVKSAKFHLKRVVGNSLMTYEAFSTIICQIEAVLNSRPLTPLSTDPEDISVLTPAHFLVGEPLTAIPEPSLEEIPVNRLNRYQAQQQRMQYFWRRWSREYLHTLQQRTKWMWEKGNVKQGDLVLLKEESSPGNWKMARVENVQPGADGHVRIVKVKTSSSSFERPIVKLIPLVENTEN